MRLDCKFCGRLLPLIAAPRREFCDYRCVAKFRWRAQRELRLEARRRAAVGSASARQHIAWVWWLAEQRIRIEMMRGGKRRG